jgi:hypothetical protein
MTMKWSIGCGVLAVVTAVSAAMAADPGKEDPNASASARKVPTVNYVVASPRAYLAGAMMGRVVDYSAMTGAAENFARPVLAKARLVEVPVGTRVLFSLDPETEGVWMRGSHGMIGTRLSLQYLRVKDCAECDDNAAADTNEAASSVDPNDEPKARRPVRPAKWVPLATDGARDIRFGPSIGCVKKVGVPVRFDKPGVYCLRGIISTSVRSWHPRTAAKMAKDRPVDTMLMPDNLLAVDVDIVHICVRVVERPVKDEDAGKPATDEKMTHASDMTNIADAEAADLGEDSPDDLGVLVGQQEGDIVLPLNEDIGN